MTPEVRKILCLFISILCFVVAGAIWLDIVLKAEEPLAFCAWGVAAYIASLAP